MANQEHLDLLEQSVKEQSVKEWNQWRKEHPEIKPELAGARLDGANLPGVNLSNADLTGASFSAANLVGAAFNGTTLWNTFFVRADLTEANFTRAHLYESILSDANLSGSYFISAQADDTDFSDAFLKGANLSHARFADCNFEDADLISAYLVGADFGPMFTSGAGSSLKKANCRDANLSRTGLTKADLSEVNFTCANLTGAILREADLSKAILGGTILVQVDLKAAKGLETIVYQGASFVDLRTIERSAGTLPEVFLQGIGASEDLIEYARSRATISTVSAPLQYYSCFISFSSKDMEFARQLREDLNRNGVRCWFAPEDLKIGDHYRQVIDDTIDKYEKVVLILSQHALASNWVESEVEKTLEKERRQQREMLFPVRLDKSVSQASQAWAGNLGRTRHIGDFTRYTDPQAYQSALERLLRDLKRGHS